MTDMLILAGLLKRSLCAQNPAREPSTEISGPERALHNVGWDSEVGHLLQQRTNALLWYRHMQLHYVQFPRLLQNQEQQSPSLSTRGKAKQEGRIPDHSPYIGAKGVATRSSTSRR